MAPAPAAPASGSQNHCREIALFVRPVPVTQFIGPVAQNVLPALSLGSRTNQPGANFRTIYGRGRAAIPPPQEPSSHEL